MRYERLWKSRILREKCYDGIYQRSQQHLTGAPCDSAGSDRAESNSNMSVASSWRVLPQVEVVYVLKTGEEFGDS